MNEGRCLCGKVRYEASPPYFAVVNCHCSMCRKHHGAAFATWAVVPAHGFRLVAGAEAIEHYVSSAQFQRSFCRHCGSVVPEPTPSDGHVIVPAGNLEGELPPPELHMFVGSKAPWYTIADALPQRDEYPPEYGMRAVDRPPREVPSEARVHGSCLCGAIAYDIDEPPLRFMYCHCSRCRRARSSAHAANLFYPLAAFRWRRTEAEISDYALAEAQRFGVAFCSRCGSGVPRPSVERGVVLVPAGSIDGEPGMRAQAHIFTASRAPWDTIAADGIPCYETLPPSLLQAPAG